MGKVLALDLGEKSLGIAISDPMQIIPIPLENFIFERFKLEQAKNKLKEVLEKEEVDLILLGYPLRTDGKKSASTLLVEKFYQSIKDLNVKIKLVDESYTTQDAKMMLSQTIKDKKKIQSLKDVAAAYIILKIYLETKV